MEVRWRHELEARVGIFGLFRVVDGELVDAVSQFYIFLWSAAFFKRCCKVFTARKVEKAQLSHYCCVSTVA
jgi:hypothetical protein